MKPERYPWWLEPAAFAGALVVRLLGLTWRMEVVRPPAYAEALAAGERFVYAFWHAQILPLTYQRRGEGITVLVSRHRDGQLITRVIEHLGYTTARGSSTRGGEAGVRELLAMAAAGHSLAITPDGPRGPAEQLKDGLVFVASRVKLRVVFIAASASDAWVLRSWDRFRVPRPFARIRVAYSEPHTVANPDEPTRAGLERALQALTLENAQRAGEPS